MKYIILKMNFTEIYNNMLVIYDNQCCFYFTGVTGLLGSEQVIWAV
jgi:hypothetical protein